MNVNKPPNERGIKVEWDEILALVVLFMVTWSPMVMMDLTSDMGATSDYEPIGVAVAEEVWPQVDHSPLTGGATVFSVVYSPDGSQIAYGDADDNVRIHDADDGSHIRTLTEAGGNVRSVTYSPDGSQIAYGSTDDNVYIHETEGVEDPDPPAPDEYAPLFDQHLVTGADRIEDIAVSDSYIHIAAGSDGVYSYYRENLTLAFRDADTNNAYAISGTDYWVSYDAGGNLPGFLQTRSIADGWDVVDQSEIDRTRVTSVAYTDGGVAAGGTRGQLAVAHIGEWDFDQLTPTVDDLEVVDIAWWPESIYAEDPLVNHARIAFVRGDNIRYFHNPLGSLDWTDEDSIVGLNPAEIAWSNTTLAVAPMFGQISMWELNETDETFEHAHSLGSAPDNWRHNAMLADIGDNQRRHMASIVDDSVAFYWPEEGDDGEWSPATLYDITTLTGAADRVTAIEWGNATVVNGEVIDPARLYMGDTSGNITVWTDRQTEDDNITIRVENWPDSIDLGESEPIGDVEVASGTSFVITEGDIFDEINDSPTITEWDDVTEDATISIADEDIVSLQNGQLVAGDTPGTTDVTVFFDGLSQTFEITAVADYLVIDINETESHLDVVAGSEMVVEFDIWNGQPEPLTENVSLYVNGEFNQTLGNVTIPADTTERHRFVIDTSPYDVDDILELNVTAETDYDTTQGTILDPADWFDVDIQEDELPDEIDVGDTLTIPVWITVPANHSADNTEVITIQVDGTTVYEAERTYQHSQLDEFEISIEEWMSGDDVTITVSGNHSADTATITINPAERLPQDPPPEYELGIELDVPGYMAHNETREYTVYAVWLDNETVVERFDVTEDATVTSGNETILTVDEDAHTITSTDNVDINTVVNVTAVWETETITENITVANQTLDNIEILPGWNRFAALIGDTNVQVIIVATLIGIVATRIATSFAGISAMQITLVVGWFAGWVHEGLVIAGLFAALFIGFNLAANINYQVRR